MDLTVRRREGDWRRLIARVRAEFHGPLTYSANFDDWQAIGFWDALDFIGLSAYFALSERPDPSLAELEEGWERALAPLEQAERRWGRPVLLTEAGFRVEVPSDARLTRPYWHRDNPESDAVYTLDEPQYAALPFAPPALSATTAYTLNGIAGTVRTPIEVSYRDPANGLHTMAVAIAPALSVTLEPAMRVLPVAVKDGTDVKVIVQKNVAGVVRGEVRLQIPAG
jgi:hypothetical protein